MKHKGKGLSNYFEIMNNFNKFYWYGFIFADGCNEYSIENKKHRFSIEIQERDREILEKLKKEIGFEYAIRNTIRIRNDKKYYYCRIMKYDIEFSKHLNNLHINTKKTKCPKIIDMMDDEFRHFLRGFSDGDGCIYFNGKRSSWSLVVHNSLVERIKEYINQETGIHLSIQPHWRTSYISSLSISGNKNVFAFLKWLYKDSNGLYLNRKHNKFLEIKEYFQNKLKNKNENSSKSSTKYKGVYRVGNKFVSQIKINNKTKYLGIFLTDKEAALSYNTAATETQGIKAVLNTI